MALRAGVRFKAEDIWDTPDDGKRYEVIDGQLFVTPPPIVIHQSSEGELYWRIRGYLQEHRLGKVYMAPIGVVLDEENGVQPDLVYVSNDHLGIITERAVEGTPDLVVEVLSPSTRSRDRGIKMRRYAAAGIAHYWMLDPVSRALDAYRLGQRGYDHVGTYGPGSVFSAEPFPGLEIPLDALWV